MIPNSDQRANGQIGYFGGQGTIAFGDLVYLDASGNWNTVVNSSANSTKMLGISLGGSAGSNGILLKGFVKYSSYGFAIGSPLYISSATGEMNTSISVVGSTDYARIVGYAVEEDVVYFNPERTWIIKS
jgi:hypothetical protein